MNRHVARQCAVQALYAIDVGGAEIDAAIAHVLEGQTDQSEGFGGFVARLVTGTRNLLPEIDGDLALHMQGWKVERVAKVELNILRLAGYESVREPQVDFAIIADEAVELAKEFSGPEAARFVNGILAKLGPVWLAKRVS